MKRQRRRRHAPSRIRIVNNEAFVEVHLDGTECIIDTQDVPVIKDYKWISSNKQYVSSSKRKTDKQSYQIHRLILGVTDPNVVVDHIDGNPLNNRRSNLRIANKSQNAMNQIKLSKNNTSGHIGVYWYPRYNKWEAYIMINRKRKYLGRFTSKENAIQARRNAEKEFFQKFAPIHN